MNNRNVKLAIVALMVVITSCNDDSPEVKTKVMTEMGNKISMDGSWESSCIDFTEFRLRESFDFEGRNLIIDINQYEGETCSNVIGNEIITIEFQVNGTIEATLNGQTITGNKISGIESSNNSNNSEAFKQTFYIDDSTQPIKLYHGVFGDDGGATSSDGYPLELHSFPISR